jgi:hypothetical protein
MSSHPETARYPRKRRVERIGLAFPILGRVGTTDVVLVDVSLLGCRLEHPAPLKVGTPVRLNFRWFDDDVSLDAEVVRCTLSTFASGDDAITVYHSGLLFRHGSDQAGGTVRRMILTQVADALEAQKANARGDIPRYMQRMQIFSTKGLLTADPAEVSRAYETTTALPYMRIARQRGYVRWTLDDGKWKKTRTRSAEQPDLGFTVWAYEDEDQIRELAEAYVKADGEMRRLIRICAELSLVVDDTIPPQKFAP